MRVQKGDSIAKQKGWIPTLTYFKDGEYVAVFNTRTQLEKKALTMTTTVYGKEQVEKNLTPMLKTGVMGVFQKPPNEVSVFFVYVLAKLTDDFHIQREKNEKKRSKKSK